MPERFKLVKVPLAVDLDDPAQVAMLKIMQYQAKVLESKEDFRKTQQPVEAPTKEKSPLPTGKNLQGLKFITENSEWDYEALVEHLHGKPKNSKEKKRLRNNMYVRVAKWRTKGWLVTGPDGEEVVAPHVMEVLEAE